jgi:hypothetical protein
MLTPNRKHQNGSPSGSEQEFNFDAEQLLAEVDTIQQELRVANERCDEIEMEVREELALEMEKQLQEQESQLQEQFQDQVSDINKHFRYL